jgi:hypothetical protein
MGAKSVDVNGKHRRTSLLMSAFLLALCSATGLLAGAITRGVASASPARTPFLAQMSATPTALPPTATATGVPTSTAVAGNQFAVSVSVSGQPHPGQDLQISASALAADSPIEGARCALGSDVGSEPLLQTWPDATTTDSTGKCAWTITLPQLMAPGVYRIRVDAYTTQYHAWSIATVRVS